MLKCLQGTAKPTGTSSICNKVTSKREDNQQGASSRTIVRNVQELHFGDYIFEKGDNTIRIGFQNFKGLTGKDHDLVNLSIRNWVTENWFDVFGI